MPVEKNRRCWGSENARKDVEIVDRTLKCKSDNDEIKKTSKPLLP